MICLLLWCMFFWDMKDWVTFSWIFYYSLKHKCTSGGDLSNFLSSYFPGLYYSVHKDQEIWLVTMPDSGLGAVKIAGKDDGCCGIFFLKYCLYIFNLIFWVSTSVCVCVCVCVLSSNSMWKITVKENHDYKYNLWLTNQAVEPCVLSCARAHVWWPKHP